MGQADWRSRTQSRETHTEVTLVTRVISCSCTFAVHVAAAVRWVLIARRVVWPVRTERTALSLCCARAKNTTVTLSVCAINLLLRVCAATHGGGSLKIKTQYKFDATHLLLQLGLQHACARGDAQHRGQQKERNFLALVLAPAAKTIHPQEESYETTKYVD